MKTLTSRFLGLQFMQIQIYMYGNEFSLNSSYKMLRIMRCEPFFISWEIVHSEKLTLHELYLRLDNIKYFHSFGHWNCCFVE